MPQLGHFQRTVQDTSGNALSGVSVTLYREGATVNGNQSGTSPLTVTVHDNGKIEASDTVFVNTTTSTTYTADSTTDTTVVLSGFGGTLSLTNGDRLVPSNSQPTLYGDDQGGATKTNPLTTSATGYADCYVEAGAYETLISGGGATTTLFQAQVVSTEAPGQVRYAHSFPGTNAGAKIAAALADITTTGSRGGIVDARGFIGDDTAPQEITSNPFSGITDPFVLLLGPCTYRTTVQLPLAQNGQRIVGSGRNLTKILAHATSFPASTAVVRLQKTGGVFGATVSDLTIDCNRVSGSIGVLMDGAQEGSGLSRVGISQAVDAGVRLSTSDTQHCHIYEVDIQDLDATASVGIDVVSTVGGTIPIERSTITGKTGITATDGIKISGGFIRCEDIHIERCTDGVDVATSGAILSSVSGHSSVTNVVNLSTGAQGTLLLGIHKNGATNVLLDSVSSPSVTSTNTNIEFYVVGEDANRQRLTSEGGIPAILNSALASRVVTFTNLDTTPSVVNGIVFKEANTGATSITDFDGPAEEGQIIIIYFTTANTTIVEGAGLIDLQGAGNFVGTAGDMLMLAFIDSAWREITRSVN